MENKRFSREGKSYPQNNKNYKKNNYSSNENREKKPYNTEKAPYNKEQRDFKGNSSSKRNEYGANSGYNNGERSKTPFKKEFNKPYSSENGYNRSQKRENSNYQQEGRKPYNAAFKRNNEGKKYNNFQKNEGYGSNGGYRKPFQKKPFVSPAQIDDYQPESPAEVRLNKYIADAGICSRRTADMYISAGNVTVNGEVMTTLGYRVQPTDEVRFDGKLLSSEKKVYLLLNKPKGFITTTNDEKGRKTVMDLVANATNVRILPVGRLDRATTGLLLLTNDGELTKKLTHPTHGVRKIYHVVLDRKLDYKDFLAIEEGLSLEDGFIQVDEISYVDQKPKNEIGVKIHSGRNRIVRRIFEHLGYQVEKLDRVVFAGLTKKDLPRGHWRHLTPQEVINLKNLR